MGDRVVPANLADVLVKVTADVHGDIEAVISEASDCDLLVICGDIINVIDYRDGSGIFGEVYGPEVTLEWAELRRRGEFEKAREVTRRAAATLSEDPRVLFARKVDEAHEAFCSRLPANVVLTFGNVDVPELIHKYIPEGVVFIESGTTTINGELWGFVGGGLPKAGIPGEVSLEDFEARLGSMSDVDVLCVHVPPALDGLNHDIVAGNDEPGSEYLVGYIERNRPRRVYYGHVHQPQVAATSHAGSEIINVGCVFRAHRTAVTHEVRQ